MSLLKNILGRVFALWAAIVFISTMLIIFIPMWVIGLWKEPKRSYIMHAIYRNWMRVFFFFTGLRLRVEGKENFLPGENYIVIFNHNSLIDVPVSVPFMPGAIKPLQKLSWQEFLYLVFYIKEGAYLLTEKMKRAAK